jgi:integrase/recombinase XerD
MSCSIKAVINRQRISKNGIASIYLRVTVNRIKKEIPMDLRWPVNKWNEKQGICKPRFEDDKECDDYNIIIRGEVAKGNEIFRYYRLADIPITINRFAYDYRNNISKSDFISYMITRINMRYADKEISGETKKKHMQAAEKLKKYQPRIHFTDFDENWCQKFDNWLRRNIKPQKKDNRPSDNTRWSIHKNVRTYMNQAKRDQIRFTYPYAWFPINNVHGKWKAIFEKDVKCLYNYYLDINCPDNYRKILRAFLFSCMTGLRISDLKRITRDNVIDDILVFVEYKKRKSNHLLKVPLNAMAKKLFNDAVEHSLRVQIFNNFAEQYANRELKEIAALLEINENLHWHVGRHTFISLYYAKTKDLLATQQFAGHESIRQTMVYTHQDPEEIKEKMRAMDDIIADSKEILKQVQDDSN